MATFQRPDTRRSSGAPAGWCLALLLAVPATGFAYVDPGAAGILIQSMIALIAFIGAFWRRLRNAFFGSTAHKETTQPLGPSQSSDAD